MEPGIMHQVKQLYEVEKLSQRQIAGKLGISRNEDIGDVDEIYES
jgi:predicted XRE-type DNA-binding protein